MPITSRAFHPMTEIPLKTHDMMRLCVFVLSMAMKKTQTPEITILAAVGKEGELYI